jgi:hypothetical protein
MRLPKGKSYFRFRIVKTSVADPGCLSWIPDPKTAAKDRGEKKICSHKYYKIVNYFIFEQVKKKLSQFTKN